MSVSNVPPDEPPEGARPAGRGYWFIPMPVYLLDTVYDPDSPVNAPAAILWAHIHRHYAWRDRVFPSYARLAEETGQSESAVKRQLNTLKAAGAVTWGAAYRARGRSSNEYALAPMEPFRFDRETAGPVQAKSGRHPSVEVKNDLAVESKSDPHPQVKNGLGIESSSYLESTDDLSLAPVVAKAKDARGQGAVPEERENPAAPNNDTDPAAAVAAAWTTTRGGRRNPAAERDIAASASQLLAAAWPLTDVIALAEDMARRQPTYRDLTRHADHWQPAAAAAGKPYLPPWCGECGDENPAARYNARFRRRSEQPCPGCHPDAPLAA